jgi:hypothetical protein
MAIERYEIEIEFLGLDSCFGYLERIKAPLTIERISKKFPSFKASGRFYFGGKDYFMIPVDIKKGLEHATEEAEEGDLVYEPKSDSIFICLTSGKMSMKVTKIGQITENLEVTKKLQKYSPVHVKIRK